MERVFTAITRDRLTESISRLLVAGYVRGSCVTLTEKQSDDVAVTWKNETFLYTSSVSRQRTQQDTRF